MALVLRRNKYRRLRQASQWLARVVQIADKTVKTMTTEDEDCFSSSNDIGTVVMIIIMFMSVSYYKTRSYDRYAILLLLCTTITIYYTVYYTIYYTVYYTILYCVLLYSIYPELLTLVV